MVDQREFLAFDGVGLSALIRAGELLPGEVLDATTVWVEELDGSHPVFKTHHAISRTVRDSADRSPPSDSGESGRPARRQSRTRGTGSVGFDHGADRSACPAHNWTHASERRTRSANMSGSPSMSVALAFDRPTGVPIGSMFTAAPVADGLLYELAFAVEKARPWADRWAPDSAIFSHTEVEGD